MKINFQLLNPDEIARGSSSWLIHTDGYCWIDTIQCRLLEAVKTNNRVPAGIETESSVRGVRTYAGEMLLALGDAAPYALEPVPNGLCRYLSVEGIQEFHQFWSEWLKKANDRYDLDDPIWDAHDIATDWLISRQLNWSDCDFSTHPRIWIWSDEHEMHWGWSLTSSSVDSDVKYTATQGQATESRDDFSKSILMFCNLLFDEIECSAPISMGETRAGILNWLRNQFVPHRTNWYQVQVAMNTVFGK